MSAPARSSRLASSLVLSLLALFAAVLAVDAVYIEGQGIDGVPRKLDVGRYPALYTGDFDDCLNHGSLFNVTKFDAAYYADNLTLLFHLDGTTNIRRENLILHISIEAYGESRFNMTYDPCKANIASMCPLNASVPVIAYATIPISPTDVAGIPSIALGIPDLEGFARLQIFANSTRTVIGCFQAVMRNGSSFSQPKAVSTVMGILTAFAALASFLTAAYGLSIPHMRTHHAHSFSVLVVFETFQSIFFSGALSVNWPSVLPAWWSNFAWSAGMFASHRIVSAVSAFTATRANVGQVGGAGSVQINNNGGLLQQIYGRALSASASNDAPLPTLARRSEYNFSNPYEYTWHGRPRIPGMPMPGTWPGFAGTLSVVDIPPAEAFLVSLIWLLVILTVVALFVVLAKLLLDLLIKSKCLKTDGFDYFRSHLGGYLAAALLRTLLVAFFTMMTLALFQFSLRGPPGPTAIAAITCIIFLGGLGGLAAYACYSRLRGGKLELCRDTIRVERGTLFRTIPFVAATRASQVGEDETREKPYLFGTMPFASIRHTPRHPARPSVHQDESFIKRRGWLMARYRLSRWWFPAPYLVYLLVRACFIGGGAQNPLAQVFGLFIWELLALPVIIKLCPFEGSRITAISIWMLSISKIVTTGLSIAFLPDFGLSRIAATVLGIIIVVVQGFVAIAVLALILIGVVSTWMSLSRNRVEFPEPLDQVRIRYYEHMEACASAVPPKLKAADSPETLAEPYFDVKDVRRAPKIGDHGSQPGLAVPESGGQVGALGTSPSIRRNRASSASSRHSVNSLRRTGRTHRVSWSSRDVSQWDAEMNRGDIQRSAFSRSGSLRIHSINTEGQGAVASGRKKTPMTPMQESLEPTWGVPVPAKAPGAESEETDGNGGDGANDVLEKVTEPKTPAATQEEEQPVPHVPAASERGRQEVSTSAAKEKMDGYDGASGANELSRRGTCGED